MKHLSLAMLALVLFAAGCAPARPESTPTATQVPATLTPSPTVTATSLPTETPIPTATLTPTPDYSVIQFTSLYFNGTSEIVLIFTLNGARGNFRMTGGVYNYECKPSTDNADQLLCRGAYQAPGREVIFNLYEASRVDPLLTKDIIIPSPYLPTPEGMTCEIESLWRPPWTGEYGCYAVTCYIGTTYYDGTPNSCETPWRWPIP